MINEWIVPASMFSLMFAMGLTLTSADFRRVLAFPRATLVGTAVQLVGMPLAGLALAYLFDLEPLLAAGLVIIAACPGGVMSNILVHLGRADTPLSITLTATATAVTLFTIPIWVRLALADAGPAAAGIEMPILGTALRLAGFTVVPVGLGMGARALWPSSARYEGWLSRLSAVLIIVALTIESIRSDDPALPALEESWLPALLLLVSALVLGLAIPRLLRLDWRQSTTIATETCIKNTVLGLFVVSQAFQSLEPAVPIVVFMSLQLPVGVGVLVFYRWVLQPREETGADPPGSTLFEARRLARRAAQVQHDGGIRTVAARAARRIWRRLFQNRNYVYRFDPSSTPPVPPADLSIQRFSGWSDIPEELREILAREIGPDFDGTATKEFREGSVLWLGLHRGSLAAYQWSRLAQHFSSWLEHLTDGDIVLFSTVTLEAYRGHGIASSMMRSIVEREVSDGRAAYIDCKAWNKGAAHSFERAGFRQINANGKRRELRRAQS